MIKTKHIIYGFELDKTINCFLSDNPNIEVIDIKYQMSIIPTKFNEGDLYYSALIIYRENNNA